MSRIFIERPIFAWVLAIIIMLGGIGEIFGHSVASHHCNIAVRPWRARHMSTWAVSPWNCEAR